MGAKLLLADDSVTIQKVVELTLADEDYEITTVSDGAAALEKAETLHPNLILADIVMPELNGYELCEKIRQNSALAETPVILLSSTFETYDETRGATVGANDHIVKPFESDELSRKIRNWIEKKSEENTVTETDALQEQEVLRSLEASVADEVPEPEIVDEDTFEFELTDEFMEEAEEMFEEPEELPAAADIPEEVLPEETLFEEEPAVSDALAGEGVPTEEEPSEIGWAETPEEIAPSRIEENPPSLQAEEEEPQMEEISPQENPAEEAEIDRSLLDEEEVEVYEIPEEFAESESEDPTIEEQPAEESVEEPETYRIEDAPVDLMDEFIAAEESVETSETVTVEEDLMDAEIPGAVRNEQMPESPAAVEKMTSFEADAAPAGPAETGKPAEELRTTTGETMEETTSFDTLYPTQGATTSEWSPEVTSFGGEPEEVTEEVVEKPLQTDVAESSTPSVTEESLRNIVQEMVNRKAEEMIERIAWEVIPDLAEVMIRKEIERLQQEVEHS
ncbi:MAG: response regulator [Deltaproteobacteria bacterium]|nr:response regulator [Deltaproteobacteria bacterium]